MRSVLVLLTVLILVLPVLPAPPPVADSGAIACRALETHTDDGLKVTVVVFHQRDPAQRSQLATLLREHSGEMVEVQAGDGAWHPARMVRMKTCFGRGLLMLAAAPPFAGRTEFLLRFPPK